MIGSTALPLLYPESGGSKLFRRFPSRVEDASANLDFVKQNVAVPVKIKNVSSFVSSNNVYNAIFADNSVTIVRKLADVDVIKVDILVDDFHFGFTRGY